ncbi:hypothetical protein E8L99_21190 [Phreatobacter aquaticus]|uniref:Uncharacterized protein n=1 Tax=Phreatobacter aquaticus TaxID=2570229 RepID=A0A4D7QVU8_9HYPH|nr:hypothetical protein [Phreatobacter aquaticus]QCK88092.1 hypothetical protein E8L99_21190 [Phreatobacter aquaticus]
MAVRGPCTALGRVGGGPGSTADQSLLEEDEPLSQDDEDELSLLGEDVSQDEVEGAVSDGDPDCPPVRLDSQ